MVTLISKQGHIMTTIYQPLPIYCGITGFEDTVTREGKCPLCNQKVMTPDADAYYDHLTLAGGQA
jgi:hypothetical protein